MIFFASARGGNLDIWTATRSITENPFNGVSHVAELASSGSERPTWISNDGCKISFLRSDTLYRSVRP